MVKSDWGQKVPAGRETHELINVPVGCPTYRLYSFAAQVRRNVSAMTRSRAQMRRRQHLQMSTIEFLRFMNPRGSWSSSSSVSSKAESPSEEYAVSLAGVLACNHNSAWPQRRCVSNRHTANDPHPATPAPTRTRTRTCTRAHTCTLARTRAPRVRAHARARTPAHGRLPSRGTHVARVERMGVNPGRYLAARRWASHTAVRRLQRQLQWWLGPAQTGHAP